MSVEVEGTFVLVEIGTDVPVGGTGVLVAPTDVEVATGGVTVGGTAVDVDCEGVFDGTGVTEPQLCMVKVSCRPACSPPVLHSYCVKR